MSISLLSFKLQFVATLFFYFCCSNFFFNAVVIVAGIYIVFVMYFFPFSSSIIERLVDRSCRKEFMFVVVFFLLCFFFLLVQEKLNFVIKFVNFRCYYAFFLIKNFCMKIAKKTRNSVGVNFLESPFALPFHFENFA